MIWPPTLLHLAIRRGAGNATNLWLPICLVWVPLFLLAIALAPLVVAAVLLLGPDGKRWKAIVAGPALFLLFCAARGLALEASGRNGGLLLELK